MYTVGYLNNSSVKLEVILCCIIVNAYGLGGGINLIHIKVCFSCQAQALHTMTSFYGCPQWHYIGFMGWDQIAKYALPARSIGIKKCKYLT